MTVCDHCGAKAEPPFKSLRIFYTDSGVFLTIDACSPEHARAVIHRVPAEKVMLIVQHNQQLIDEMAEVERARRKIIPMAEACREEATQATL